MNHELITLPMSDYEKEIQAEKDALLGAKQI
jgi:hypothetical protein